MKLSDSQVDAIRADQAAITQALESLGVKFKGRTCRCPFHDDRTASAGIYFKDGAWKFKCQACQEGGDVFDIRAKANKTTVAEELQREAMKLAPLPKSSAPAVRTFPTLESIIDQFKTVQSVYKYTNPDTQKIDMAVIRWTRDGKKCFTQCSPAPGGEWWMKAPDTRPIYNRARIRTAPIVFVVEGEKCVHALHDIGFVATTSPQGAKSPTLADWSPLAGKDVVIWQDNDDAGTEYATAVQKILVALSPPVKLRKVIHEAFDLPKGGDVADFIDRYQAFTTEEKRAAVQDAIDDARPIGIVGDYAREIEETISGKRRAVPFPYPRLSRGARALMPGTVTCIFGPPGSSKSLLLMDCICAWNEPEIETKVCIFMLEDDRNYHLRRAHAQIASNSRIMDNDWIEANADFMRESVSIYRNQLEKIGRCIWDAPENDVGFDMLTDWVEQRAKDGFEVICIDPITAAQATEKPWVADQKFIFKVKSIAKRYGTRIILVTHPRKGQKPMMVGLDDMAGGAAYQRFSHTVLLIEKPEEEEVSVREDIRSLVTTNVTPNRVIRISKARNGPGAGRQIAMEFSGDTLRFKELGIIEKVK